MIESNDIGDARFDALPVIERLFERVERAESALAGDHLRPVADRFAAVLARCREQNNPGTAASVADDIRDALEACFGLEEVPCRDYDPCLHDVQEVLGQGENIAIERVIRPGFRRANQVLRPALVVLRRH